MKRTITLFWLLFVTALPCFGQAPNPFLPPQSKANYEPERQYDLQHVKLDIKLDWPNRRFSGRVTHTIEMFRASSDVEFDAGPHIKIKSCIVNGQSAKFDEANGKLKVHSAGPLNRGAKAAVVIVYESVPPQKGPSALNGMYGFHWVLPDKFEPQRKPAFWTQGETVGNREWVPIYDYPNDKTTSETIVECPETWFVVGNGKLVEDRSDPKRHTRTLHWSMTQPHATYLLSLAGGEMDVVKSAWEGIDLYYCVPRGEGSMIPASFGDTPDMLAFFSKTLGVKYPWPKYAQTAMFDFGGGMENVSATTLGEDALADPRSGTRPMASLNSHELAHQWLGDLITCKDWGHIWLNEGFASFLQYLYFEHARGKDAYDHERENALQSYLGESRRYKRPIVTRYYPNPDQMFDSHTYPKGALVLHMLRREMGDEDFFQGLRHFLTKYAYQSVDTNDFLRSMQEATGRSLESFFEQWVYKPGHPVIDYSWHYDDVKKEVVIGVSQLQETKDGTPVYDLRMPYAIITGSSSVTAFAKVEHATEQIRLPAATKPDAVLLDPGHDLLMERKEKKWQPGEREATLVHAPCWLDRRDAALSLLADNPPDQTIELVVKQTGEHPLLDKALLTRLGQLKRPSLKQHFIFDARPFELQIQISPAPTNQKEKPPVSRDPDVVAAAIGALGQLPHDKELAKIGVSLLDQNEVAYPVARAILDTLAGWDADLYLPEFTKAVQRNSRQDTLRVAALNAIARSTKDEALGLLVRYAQNDNSRAVRSSAVKLLEGRTQSRPKVVQTFASLLRDEDPQVVREVLSALGRMKEKSLVPAIRQLEKESKDASVREGAKTTADMIEKN